MTDWLIRYHVHERHQGLLGMVDVPTMYYESYIDANWVSTLLRSKGIRVYMGGILTRHEIKQAV
jgi:hypothetical protein